MIDASIARAGVRNKSLGCAPRRIVCLTGEIVETLYLLRQEDRIVGISGFAVRPPRARREKPKVSAFTSARIEKIVALDPDLVLGFSDLQAELAAQLIRVGLQVLIFNQRTVKGIFDMVQMLGAMVGATAAAETLLARLRKELEAIRESAVGLRRRPRVYFEEWDQPLICGIAWVSELIALAGGEDCFAELSQAKCAKERVVNDPREVIRRAPDVIIGSWCGKRFRPEKVCQRPGWDAIPAVQNGHLYEIKSADILQPGPGALTEGVRQLHNIVRRWAESDP